MSKTNIETSYPEIIATRLGVAMMAAATVLGMTELVHTPEMKVLANLQPAYAFAGEGPVGNPGRDNNVRRERDDLGKHDMSYGIAMRTPSRAGKL